jgi:hypothetical protein
MSSEENDNRIFISFNRNLIRIKSIDSIEVVHKSVVIYTNGRTITEEFSEPYEAEQAYDELIEKLGGRVLV